MFFLSFYYPDTHVCIYSISLYVCGHRFHKLTLRVCEHEQSLACAVNSELRL